MAELSTLFAGIGLVSAICLAVGLIFCVIECFVPGFGFFGITGGCLIVFGIVFRMIMGGTWWHFLYMCAMVMLALGILFLIFVRSARFGVLSKTPLIENSTALPKDYASQNTYGFLLGQNGITITDCKPAGKVRIDDVEYQVITNGEYLEIGTLIEVVEIDGNSIVVKKI